MIIIDRVTLNLPLAYKHRATVIAQLVKKEMAQVKLTCCSQKRDTITPHVQIEPNMSNRAIALIIRMEITKQLESDV
jgi:hypothetical protein